MTQLSHFWVCPEELKTGPKTDTGTPMFIVMLFTVAKMWSQPKCLSTEEWMNKMWPAAAAKSPQSCPTLCDPIDGSLPSSPIPGILQAWTLEWVAISFSENVAYTHNTVEYYSALKRKITSYAAMWMNLENIMPSEINQS